MHPGFYFAIRANSPPVNRGTVLHLLKIEITQQVHNQIQGNVDATLQETGLAGAGIFLLLDGLSQEDQSADQCAGLDDRKHIG